MKKKKKRLRKDFMKICQFAWPLVIAIAHELCVCVRVDITRLKLNERKGAARERVASRSQSYAGVRSQDETRATGAKFIIEFGSRRARAHGHSLKSCDELGDQRVAMAATTAETRGTDENVRWQR